MRRAKKPAPIPAQRNAGHPNPSPASVILHLAGVGCPEAGCRMMEGGGGGGLGGPDKRTKGNDLGLLN